MIKILSWLGNQPLNFERYECESTILATVSHGVNLAHGVMGALGGGQ